jgi:RimJ/RimL family protein N-acetyltransferase
MSVAIPVLHTERLVLRGFTAADVEPFAEIVADPEVVRFIDDGEPIDHEQTWRGIALFIGHWTLRGYGWWAAEHRDTGEFLGRIGLYNPEGWPGIEVGWLLRREAWGHGLATEGALAALDFAFDEVGADHVISLIDPANKASIRVAEKIGERFEGELLHGGKTVACYGLTRSSRHSRQR